MRRQTYGYFPSFRTSPPLHQYKIILLRDRSRHASAACPVLCSTAQVRLVCLSARPRSESESSFLTAHQSLVSGWSESLDSITNHLAKLQFESPSVSESSDAGHDLLCCWYLQRSLHSPTGVPRIDRSSAPGWNRFLYTMAEDRETSYSAWWYSQVHTLHKGTCQLLLSHDWRFDWQLMCYTQLQQPHAVVVNRMAYEGEELQPSNYIRSANDNSRMVVVNLPKSVRH